MASQARNKAKRSRNLTKWELRQKKLDEFNEKTGKKKGSVDPWDIIKKGWGPIPGRPKYSQYTPMYDKDFRPIPDHIRFPDFVRGPGGPGGMLPWNPLPVVRPLPPGGIRFPGGPGSVRPLPGWNAPPPPKSKPVYDRRYRGPDSGLNNWMDFYARQAGPTFDGRGNVTGYNHGYGKRETFDNPIPIGEYTGPGNVPYPGAPETRPWEQWSSPTPSFRAAIRPRPNNNKRNMELLINALRSGNRNPGFM